jgi:cytidylate kinase
MNIDPLKTSSNQAYSLQSLGQNQNGAPQQAGAAKDESDTLSAEMTDKVRASLAAMPEIRPEVVERGRQLAANPNWPTPEIINNIAGMITPFSAED